MTNQQAGREAFEALVERWREGGGTFFCGDGPPYRAAMADCADELEAALAQQGREVGEPVAWIHKDGRALLLDESMHRATNPPDWNPLYTSTPKQQAVEVTEEMVEAACEAYFDDGVHGWSRFAGTQHTAKLYRKAMRKALLAALAGKTEVGRG